MGSNRDAWHLCAVDERFKLFAHILAFGCSSSCVLFSGNANYNCVVKSASKANTMLINNFDNVILEKRMVVPFSWSARIDIWRNLNKHFTTSVN